MTLIAEDLLLLLLEDTSGKPLLDSTRLDRVLAGAVLIELALTERLTPAAPGSGRRGTLTVHPDRLIGDPVLDGALARLADGRPPKASRAVEKLVKGLRPTLLTRLADAGYLREEHARVLGIFPSTRWPAADPSHEAGLREELTAALVHGTTPSRRAATLISLLVAVDAVPKVVASADKRALVRRAKEIAQGDWAGEAVRQAVDAVNAALIAVAVVASTAGAAGSG